ncbi:septum formation initiator family protein [Geomicrobium sp. JCM 19039]|uniref:FtsB family cell division protein n=1 Tax=Geomicrobium sp. JCM 19039 TaxID=1460636 RepID=UPI00045F42EE|nr:septum formation initiator family protein [Geomicrobium sp. JCM 19039]GAK13907.1 cell division protein DivIC [Geomicrobium sp. JCM 19039]
MSKDRKKVTAIHRDKHYEQEQERLAAREARRRIGLRRRLTMIGIVGAVVLIFASIGLVSQQSMIDANEKEQQLLDEQYAELQLEQQRLEQEIENYNDIDYIAEVARRDLYLTKPGETIFKVPEYEEDEEDEDS